MSSFSAFMDKAKEGLSKSAKRISAFSSDAAPKKPAKKQGVSLKKKHPEKFKKYLMDDASDDKSFKEYLKDKNIGI